MIHAYDENYLEKAMERLGDMIEYAVLDCNYNADIFFRLFIEIGVASRFEMGDPSILVGHSGPELVQIIIDKTQGKKSLPTPLWREDRSEYYWCGWSLAYYQWVSRKSFLYIWSKVSIDTMRKMYSTLHEADISKTVDVLDKLTKGSNKLPIGYLRKIKGFTQKQLSEAAGINISQLQRLEYGKRKVENLTLKIALSLSNALGVRVEELE